MKAESFRPSAIKHQISDSPQNAFKALIAAFGAQTAGGIDMMVSNTEAIHKVIGGYFTTAGLILISFCAAGIRRQNRLDQQPASIPPLEAINITRQEVPVAD